MATALAPTTTKTTAANMGTEEGRRKRREMGRRKEAAKYSAVNRQAGGELQISRIL